MLGPFAEGQGTVMDGATREVLILGSLLSSFLCLYPLQQGLQEGIWGMGEEAHNPKEKVLWTGLSGTCGGHVAGPWSPGATAPGL